MSLNITFKITNSLTSAAQLKIQIPSAISTISTNMSLLTCSILSNTTPSAILSTISCTLLSNVVTIPTFLQATLPSNSFLSIILSNIFKNP